MGRLLTTSATYSETPVLRCIQSWSVRCFQGHGESRASVNGFGQSKRGSRSKGHDVKGPFLLMIATESSSETRLIRLRRFFDTEFPFGSLEVLSR